jgi:hypothetical protein
MERKMETGPPEVIERFVRALTPAACREHVLGDLRERYSSPTRYLRDALNTIPFVVGSGMRRVFHPGLSAIAAAIFWGMVYQGPLQPGWGILLALIPALLSVAALVLRDVYRIPGMKPFRAAAIDVVCVLGVGALWQALLRLTAPHLMALDAVFSLVGLAGLFLLRAQIPSGLSPKKTFTGVMTLQELTAEIGFFETTLRRAVNIEMTGCIVAVVFFSGSLLLGPPLQNLGEKIAVPLIIAGAAFVGLYMYRHCRIRSIPRDLGFRETAVLYREQLEYRCSLSATYVYWYVLPLLVPVAVYMLIVAANFPIPFVVAAVPIVIVLGLFAALLVAIQRGVRKKAIQRIEELRIVEEAR